ncbi:JAB domain-containing protein [Undibacterium sp. Di24W]|uniref:JAB domain-containing protein n=1 Tax=Undibacterium sp. Di24W TaxID=3413033 RepID=UPI003BF0CC86
MIAELTSNTTSLYISLKCLKSRLNSGMSPRQSVAFFTPIAFSMGAMDQECKTRKGNTDRSAVYEISTSRPPHSLEIDCGGLFKSLKQEPFMPIPSLRDRDARTVARAIRILEKSFNTESGTPLSSPDAAKQYLRLKLGSLEHEEFHAVWMDNKNQIVAIEPLFRGTLTYCQIHPREVIKSALRHNAASVIFAHNHPSGKAIPSNADIDLTVQLRDALAIVDVRVLDHIIVAGSDICSLIERGDI